MEGLSEEGVKGMLSGDYKTARHLETVKKRETDLPGGSVALEPVVYFHASLHSNAEGSPTMGTEVTAGEVGSVPGWGQQGHTGNRLLRHQVGKPSH